MVNNHTPGPWHTDTVYAGNVYSSDVSGSIVATCKGFAYAPRSEDEQNANALLIAAAPDLLAACQKFVDSFKSLQREKCDIACQMAKDALKKAGVR